MTAWFLQVDSVLRGTPRKAPHAPTLGLAGLCLTAVYGAIMGGFPDAELGPRPLQMLYSGLKVPVFLLLTFVVALPSFFVLNTLLGVRDDFGRVLATLGQSQFVVAVALVCLSPLTVFWYVSVPAYPLALLFNGVMFLTASIAGQIALVRGYAPLVRRNPVHRKLLIAWLVLFTFVGIQLAWVLRPFIGSPGKPTQFFREGAWGNAYVEVVSLVWKTLFGG